MNLNETDALLVKAASEAEQDQTAEAVAKEREEIATEIEDWAYKMVRKIRARGALK